MIHLRPLTLRDRLLERIFPSRRRERERRIEDGMRRLMEEFEERHWVEDFFHNIHLADGKGRWKDGC